MSIIPDKMIDFSRPDVPIDRKNKTALVIDIALPLIHNLSNTGQRKLQTMKIWPWKLKKSGSLTHWGPGI
jgi:hypothetical protein